MTPTEHTYSQHSQILKYLKTGGGVIIVLLAV